MKIAILSNPWIPLPPTSVGGTERVLYNLQAELVRQNHDVTVFATGDSKIQAKLAYFYEKALGSSGISSGNSYYLLNTIYHFMKLLEREHFDIVHLNDNFGYSLYFAEYFKTPFVTTLHGSYEKRLEDPIKIFEEKRKHVILFKDYPYVTISHAQQSYLPELTFTEMIYNSIIIEEFEFSPLGGEYMTWIGRISSAKGVDIAFDVAQSVKKPFEFCGQRVDNETEYFTTKIEPRLEQPYIKYRGETNTPQEKSHLLSNAKVFLFPLQWEEPFGIVMAEAMACGTPVIAFARGAATEIIQDGVTGYLVNPSDTDIRGDWAIKSTGIAGLQEAVERLYGLSAKEYSEMRKSCREFTVKNFSTQVMGQKYIDFYQKILSSK